MITVTKEFSFDFAHMLDGHEGLCKNLHGHTYKLQVEIAGKGYGTIMHGPAKGMVMDFKDLKEIIKEEIVDKYDHSFVMYTNTNDPAELEIGKILQMYGKRIVLSPYRPTAENMAEDWFEILEEKLAYRNIKLVAIRLWETPTSYAEIRDTEY